MDEVIRRIPTTRLIWDASLVANRTFDDRVRQAASAENLPFDPAAPDPIIVDGVRFIILPLQPRVALSD